MSNILKIAGAGVSAAAEETDENFNQTVLLLHGDNTNGAQNNTFLDSSTNNFTITRNGNTTQGTFSPFSAPDGRWSNYFDGDNDGLSVANVAATQVGSNNFTFQCWFYPTSATATFRNLFSQGTSGVYSPFNITQNGTEISVVISTSGTSWAYGPTGAGTVLINSWNHLAFVRSGNDFACFLNGARTHNTTLSGALMTPTQPTTLGVRPANDQDYIGWISNWQLVNGTALYDPTGTTITVPTSPLSAGQTDQELLLCYSNRFVDSNTDATAKTVTVVGAPKVTPFSPFAPTAAYDASVNGGSGYFDGSGDYLNTPSNSVFNPSGQDITVDFWVYMTSYPSTANCIFEVGTGAVNDMQCLVINTGDLRFQIGNVVGSAKTGFQLNRWHHVTCVKSGTNFTVYLDAVAGTTVSLSPNSKTQLFIGATGGGTIPMQGYISNFRYIQGSAIAPTSVPTAPLTAITNTSLLLNFTNAGIFDNTGKNNLETVGNAQIDTTTKKYGTGSMEFDGTGDRLVLPASENFVLTGDFTIEMWAYINTAATQAPLITWGDGAYKALAYLGGAWRLEYPASSSVDLTGAFTKNQWVHYALTRSGSTVRWFIDGVLTSTNTISATIGTNEVVRIGNKANDVTEPDFNGFIDDLRITKGVARYTTTFTPPTKAFPDL